MSKVELVKASTIEIKPGHKYLIVLDQAAVSEKTATDLSEALVKIGMKASVALMVGGDPEKVVKVIEQVEDGKDAS